MNPIVNYLMENAGYSYDIEIPEQLFENNTEFLEQTDLTTVTYHFPEARSYRDSKPRKSVHLQDYRGIDRENRVGDVLVAHLERFNPEYHPILHALIDYPIWFYKNNIREKNKL